MRKVCELLDECRETKETDNAAGMENTVTAGRDI